MKFDVKLFSSEHVRACVLPETSLPVARCVLNACQVMEVYLLSILTKLQTGLAGDKSSLSWQCCIGGTEQEMSFFFSEWSVLTA